MPDTGAASVAPEDLQGQPCIRLCHAGGSSALVALHGAQVLSWHTADGTERFYLSPDALFDGSHAIRGGTPICFPQFNTRGPLPKHGFARNTAWQCAEHGTAEGGEVYATLCLRDSEATRALWPVAFEARLRVHSYLRVRDLAHVRLHGLEGAPVWDAVRDARHAEAAAPLAFTEEFDRVYAAPGHVLHLREPSGGLAITQSASFADTVVWNPGAALCATFKDMPAEDYRHMLCVEAACVEQPVHLAPGAQWHGWQELAAL
jgi:glucose-6-phosphate 1-epimerase